MLPSVVLTTILAIAAPAVQPEGIRIEAADGLLVTADWYAAHPDPAPLIVLFHQAGWSRGEYREIAPKLNALGFNCLAVDQRSGGEVNGVKNETAARAKRKKLGTSYVDARPDLEAALGWARAEHPKAPVIAWGSSYSAALVLRLAGERPELVDGVLAFAPGEYFKRARSPSYVREGAQKIKKPVFITSARSEKKNWWRIYEAIPASTKQAYVPQTQGRHGSRALWAKFSDSAGYWKAVRTFLGRWSDAAKGTRGP